MSGGHTHAVAVGPARDDDAISLFCFFVQHLKKWHQRRSCGVRGVSAVPLPED